MNSLSATDGRHYHSFLLRVWREHENASWRISLRSTDGGAAVGFAGLEELSAYLARELGLRAAGQSQVQEGSSARAVGDSPQSQGDADV